MGSVAAFRLSQASDIPSDRDLITRTLDGDGGAFGMLVERFQRKIYRVAYTIVRDDAEADSITQDTFVQAYTHLAKFEGRSEFETWLTRIAINRSRDSLRRRRFVSLFVRTDRDDEDEVEMLEPADDRPDPERQIMAGQLAVAIERAVERLSSQQKIIFRLRHYDHYSLEEIAEMLGLAAGTVRAHLFRAIHKVRAELGEWATGQGNDHDDEALQ